MPDYLQTVALIGASGNIGAKVLAALVDQNQHKLTVIARQTSKATFPPTVTVYRGDLKDPEFLQSSLAGQDVMVSVVAHEALSDEALYLQAAERAGVKIFIPSDYGNPLSDERFIQAIPSLKRKLDLVARARRAGIVAVNVVTSFWIDLMLENNLLEYEINAREATLYTDSLAHNTTTTAQVARAIARLLTLPYSTIHELFKDDPDLHISSFFVSQQDIFRAVLDATGTQEGEWTVTQKRSDDLLQRGIEKQKKDENDIFAMVDVSLGLTYKYGGPGAVGAHNELLQLPREDLREVVKRAIETAQAR